MVRGFRRKAHAHTDHTGSRVTCLQEAHQLPQPRLVGDVLGRKQPACVSGGRGARGRIVDYRWRNVGGQTAGGPAR
eukprot:scaffold132020_cov54-Phaeocystis_antarctica.AAC.2